MRSSQDQSGAGLSSATHATSPSASTPGTCLREPTKTTPKTALEKAGTRSLGDHAQRSEAWFAARIGKITASRIADVLSRTRDGWGAARRSYLAELAAERLTGERTDGFVNDAMLWGIDTESAARIAYAAAKEIVVDETGFIDHPRVEKSGASPDGLIGASGLVEIKCPNTATHIETLRTNGIPQKYWLQMQWQMACTERAWCDYVSFDPRMPKNMQLFVQRVSRDQKQITEIEFMVTAFSAEVDEMVADLHKRYGI